MAAEPWPNGWIVQPFVAGRALSMAAIVRGPEDFDLLPAGEQHLSPDGRLTYQGGTIPVRDCSAAALESLVAEVIRKMPGLQGWIGFDLLVPGNPKTPPLMIEINPRLTTSYIGYRALTEENLARRIVRGHSNGGGAEPFGAIAWSGRVRFQADGTVQRVD
jgi:predicted ATP-grasp superfamily ATP-dependent carboligase